MIKDILSTKEFWIGVLSLFIVESIILLLKYSFKKVFNKKAKLKPLKKVEVLQQSDDLKVARLIIQNTGGAVAINTSAKIIQINDNNKIRESVPELPLYWMHAWVEGEDPQTIPPKKGKAKIDIINIIKNSDGSVNLKIASKVGREKKEWVWLNQGHTELIIIIDEKGGSSIKKIISIDWDGSFNLSEKNFSIIK